MKKLFEYKGTVSSLHPPITPWLSAGLCIIQPFKTRTDGSGTGIGCSINDTRNPGFTDRPRTHQTWFQRHNQHTVAQSVVAQAETCPPQGQNFRMGRRIMKNLGLVVGEGKDISTTVHNQCSHRNFS